MSRQRKWALTVIGFVAVSVALLAVTFAVGNKPQLGLDLRGGLSTTLQPLNPHVSSDAIKQAKQIIDSRVNALGVAEPDITVQGKTVVVQLPGVKDPDRAKAVIGRTAKMEFRPLLAPEWQAPVNPKKASSSSSSSTSTTSSSSSTTTTQPSAASPAVKQAKTYGNPEVPDVVQSCLATKPAQVANPLKPGEVILPGKLDPGKKVATCYWMGPVGFKGEALSGAQAQLQQNGQWVVGVNVKNSKQGQANSLMNACYSAQTQRCPATGAAQSGGAGGRMAIVLDGQVLSSPTVDSADLASQANGFIIEGQFTHDSASQLALELRYGSLPVTFKEATFQKVSATLGKDSLHAGLIAGAVGLLLVAIYILAFYRLLGLIALGSLATATALLWAIISYAGVQYQLALTLSGITGIIVSIGVAVDSNVVCYEHLREDIGKGRTLRQTVDRSWKDAWRVIVSADLVSIIGAALLYWLTVGSVRGFAFYLGLSTLLDLVAAWFFMRPLVLLIGHAPRFQDRLGLLGIGPRRRDRRRTAALPEGARAR